MNNYPSVVVIAEAGVNHNGNFNRAKSLIDAAADVGADVVKFQAFKTENIGVWASETLFADLRVLDDPCGGGMLDNGSANNVSLIRGWLQNRKY